MKAAWHFVRSWDFAGVIAIMAALSTAGVYTAVRLHFYFMMMKVGW